MLGRPSVSKMTMLVKNNDGRNENDATIFYTLPGSGEKKGFETGDILASGKTITLKVPTKFVLKTGAKVRIETNFDEPFFDAKKSCTITL